MLTPREEEVLALIKAGLSNREIAERLDISLAGAKFHVSEIIGKLGVSRREEAAEWRGQRAPIFLLPRRKGSAASLAPRTIGTFLVALLATAGFVVVIVSWGKPGSDSFLGSDSPKPAAVRATPDTPSQSFVPVPQVHATLQQAPAQASFQPRLPTYIPAGYTLSLIEHTRFPMIPPSRPDVHNDWITVTYRDSEGHKLMVSQGFPAMPGPGSYLRAPEDRKGVVDVAGRELYWVEVDALRASPVFSSEGKTFVPALHEGGLLLAWEVRRFGPGWALSTGRSGIVYGSPFEYGIASDVLSLDELTRIALSVPFITDPSLTP